MNKILSLILLVLFSVNVFAANSAVESTLPITYNFCKDSVGAPVVEVTAVTATYDVVDTDLVVYTPAAGNFVAVIGVYMGGIQPSIITYKSGSDIIGAIAHNAPFVYAVGMSNKLLFTTTTAGDALSISSSATLSDFTIYIVEYARCSLQ